MSDGKITKRFIAGAVCPRCNAMDRLVIFRRDDKDFRECVSCGFLDEMRLNTPKNELETRVNTPEAVKAAQTQAVKWLEQ